MRLTLRRRAERDLDEAYAWYESRSRGLGDRFLRVTESCLDRIRQDPEFHPIQYDRVRRARLQRFPHSVYYVMRDDRIDVLAVYHARRRPRRFDDA